MRGSATASADIYTWAMASDAGSPSMNGYSNVLIAVDLSDESARVVQRGMELAGRYGAQVTLLHVVEFIPVDPAGEALLPPPMDLEGEMVAGARRKLDELCARCGVAGL